MYLSRNYPVYDSPVNSLQKEGESVPIDTQSVYGKTTIQNDTIGVSIQKIKEE